MHLGVKSPRQLSLDNHGNNAKHPTDQRVVAQLFALPKESSPLTQPVADVLGLLLWYATFLTIGLTGVFSDDFGKGVLQDGTVKKLNRLVA